MSAFQQRHYEAIALALREAKPDPDDRPRTYAWQHCVHTTALMLSNDSERFDITRFCKACDDLETVAANEARA